MITVSNSIKTLKELKEALNLIETQGKEQYQIDEDGEISIVFGHLEHGKMLQIIGTGIATRTDERTDISRRIFYIELQEEGTLREGVEEALGQLLMESEVGGNA